MTTRRTVVTQVYVAYRSYQDYADGEIRHKLADVYAGPPRAQHAEPPYRVATPDKAHAGYTYHRVYRELTDRS